MSAVSPPIDEKAYAALLAAQLPRVVQTEAENQQYIAALEALYDRGNGTPEEQQLARLMTLLIQDFESKYYALKSASPVEIVRELMAANGLKPSDMLDVFSTKSVVSEVLNGKRDLSKAHIQKLAERFRVDPGVFFPRHS